MSQLPLRTRRRGWIFKVTVSLVAVITLLVGMLFLKFSIWKADHVRELGAMTQVAHTAQGDIEYVKVGSGTPYLYFHGSPGNFTTGLASRSANPNGYRDVMTIAVSRPGYLRTPLTSGKSFEQQADLFSALLDQLGIERAVVVAASGGGYDGLQFALRHPDRCIALVMLAPAVRYEPSPPNISSNSFARGLQDFALWTMAQSRTTLGLMVKNFDSSDDVQVGALKGLVFGLIPIMSQVDGARNDVAQRTDPAIDTWPLESIRVPTLLIHGTADENSPYKDSVYVAAKIPNEPVEKPDFVRALAGRLS